MSLPLQKGRLGRGLASLIGEAPRPTRHCPRTASSVCCRSRTCIRAASTRARISTTSSWPSWPSRSAPRAWCSRSSPVPTASAAASRSSPASGAGARRRRRRCTPCPSSCASSPTRMSPSSPSSRTCSAKDLNPIEEAAGYNELIERFRYTQEEVAEMVGKSRSHLANTLRLLKLPPDRAGAGARGQAHAWPRARARRPRGCGRDRPADRRQRPHRARCRDVGAGAGRHRRADRGGRRDRHWPEPKLGRGLGGGPQPPAREPPAKDADTVAFEKDLSDALGLAVEVKRGSGESGSPEHPLQQLRAARLRAQSPARHLRLRPFRDRRLLGSKPSRGSRAGERLLRGLCVGQRDAKSLLAIIGQPLRVAPLAACSAATRLSACIRMSS